MIRKSTNKSVEMNMKTTFRISIRLTFENFRRLGRRWCWFKRLHQELRLDVEAVRLELGHFGCRGGLAPQGRRLPRSAGCQSRTRRHSRNDRVLVLIQFLVLRTFLGKCREKLNSYTDCQIPPKPVRQKQMFKKRHWDKPRWCAR